jgi:hypothetical protein
MSQTSMHLSSRAFGELFLLGISIIRSRSFVACLPDSVEHGDQTEQRGDQQDHPAGHQFWIYDEAAPGNNHEQRAGQVGFQQVRLQLSAQRDHQASS